MKFIFKFRQILGLILRDVQLNCYAGNKIRTVQSDRGSTSPLYKNDNYREHGKVIFGKVGLPIPDGLTFYYKSRVAFTEGIEKRKSPVPRTEEGLIKY